MRTVIIDTNLWCYFADRGGAKPLFQVAQDAGLRVALPPSILLEVLRNPNSTVRRQHVRALKSGNSIKLKSEAQQESQEFIDAVRLLRPEWMRRIPLTGNVAKHETFWTKRIWRMTPDEEDRMSLSCQSDYSSADAAQNAEYMKATRKDWLDRQKPWVKPGIFVKTAEWADPPDWLSMASLMSPLVARWKSPPCVGFSGGDGRLRSVFHAVGIAVGDDDGGVVEQAVEDARGGGVFGEESAPVFEWPV